MALVTAAVSGSSELLWVVGQLVGAALGASRRLTEFCLRLIPCERQGEDFGLYALVGKVSNGFGPLVL
jgi:MFS-type transporter involved in bile tolerance (Atg22 family)